MEQNKSSKENNHRKKMARRDFLNTSALSTASLIAGNMFFLPAANAQRKNDKNMKNNLENGQFPAEGMGAYFPSGPLKRMNFHR